MIFLPQLKKALRAVESGSQKPSGNDRADRIARFILEARKRFQTAATQNSATSAMLGQAGLAAINNLLVLCATDKNQKEFDGGLYKIIGAISQFLDSIGGQQIKF